MNQPAARLLRGRVAKLVVAGDRDRALVAVKAADRPDSVAAGDRRAHVLHIEPHGGERDRIDAHADRGLLGAVDVDFGDAFDLREPLSDHRVGGVIEGAGRNRL